MISIKSSSEKYIKLGKAFAFTNAFSFLFFLTVPSWAVYKCASVDGKISFQDAACEKDSHRLGEVSPQAYQKPQPTIYKFSTSRPPMGDPEYERQRAAERAQQLDRYAKDAGAAIKASSDKMTQSCGQGPYEPLIGASSAWIRSCSTWGEPSEVNTTTTKHGKTMQWVYRHRGFMYFNESGSVIAIQQ